MFAVSDVAEAVDTRKETLFYYLFIYLIIHVKKEKRKTQLNNKTTVWIKWPTQGSDTYM